MYWHPSSVGPACHLPLPKMETLRYVSDMYRVITQAEADGKKTT